MEIGVSGEHGVAILHVEQELRPRYVYATTPHQNTVVSLVQELLQRHKHVRDSTVHNLVIGAPIPTMVIVQQRVEQETQRQGHVLVLVRPQFMVVMNVSKKTE